MEDNNGKKGDNNKQGSVKKEPDSTTNNQPSGRNNENMYEYEYNYAEEEEVLMIDETGEEDNEEAATNENGAAHDEEEVEEVNNDNGQVEDESERVLRAFMNPEQNQHNRNNRHCYRCYNPMPRPARPTRRYAPSALRATLPDNFSLFNNGPTLYSTYSTSRRYSTQQPRQNARMYNERLNNMAYNSYSRMMDDVLNDPEFLALGIQQVIFPSVPEYDPWSPNNPLSSIWTPINNGERAPTNPLPPASGQQYFGYGPRYFPNQMNRSQGRYYNATQQWTYPFQNNRGNHN